MAALTEFARKKNIKGNALRLEYRRDPHYYDETDDSDDNDNPNVKTPRASNVKVNTQGDNSGDRYENPAFSDKPEHVVNLHDTHMARVTADFDSEGRSGYLSLKKNDIVEVVDKRGVGKGGWWLVCTASGASGLAPSNFLAPEPATEA